MRMLIAAAAGVLCASIAASAQDAPAPAPTYPEFEARVHKDPDGKTLPYRLLVPKGYDAAKPWPLVVWLHGSGERGANNRLQLANFVAEAFLSDSARLQFPCFVMAPQCSLTSGWMSANVNRVGPVSDSTRMTVATVLELCKEFKIDDRRIYISGFSAGAYGTWEMLARYPRLFAAAVPMAGCPDGRDKLVPRFKNTPIWAFHGDKDGNAPIAPARRMAALIKEAGGDCRWTEFAGVGHVCTTQAFSQPGFFEWLFAQKRATPSSAEPVTIPEDAVPVIKTLPIGTHGTWTGAVSRTSHGAPRLAIDDVRYRLVRAEGLDDEAAALLRQIGQGKATGRCEVTGTVMLDESDRPCITVEAVRKTE